MSLKVYKTNLLGDGIPKKLCPHIEIDKNYAWIFNKDHVVMDAISRYGRTIEEVEELAQTLAKELKIG